MNASTKHVVSGLLLVPTLLAANALAQDPKNAGDDSWISLSGTIVAANADSFRLDHGSGVITVEMDDFDFYPEGYKLLENDKVVVSGIVDDDLFEKKTIEASTVFVENLGTHFYANPADEEDFASWTVSVPVVLEQVEVTGKITAVEGREMTLDSGKTAIRVDTKQLGFNPMDDKGFLKLEKGDRVKVGGDIDPELFGKHEVSANWIIELND